MAGSPPKPRENEQAPKNLDCGRTREMRIPKTRGRTRKPGIPGTVREPEKWEYPKREGELGELLRMKNIGDFYLFENVDY
jgi:hypothetical protein